MDPAETRIFLGSSKEAQRYAEVIQAILYSFDAKVTAWWSDDAFPVGSTFIESVVRLTTLTDASLLIAGEDDITSVRGETAFTARDNVIFEHGIFTASHGRQRSAIAMLGRPKLPTDLLGVVAIQLHASDSMSEFKEKNRDPIRKWFDALTRPIPVAIRLHPETRELLTQFMKQMDKIWDEFDAGWELIHLRNYAAEANFALALDEFFQQYHGFFVSLRNSDTPRNEQHLSETIQQANLCLLRGWEQVAQGKMHIADDDERDSTLQRTRRQFRYIKDQAAVYLKEGRNRRVSLDRRLIALKKSVTLIDEFLNKTVEGQVNPDGNIHHRE